VIRISNQYAGKRVRIQGVIPTDPIVEGIGNHTGTIENVEGKRFTFREDGNLVGQYAHLRCDSWRIVEVFNGED
jgi:hypothetical protein